MNFFLYLSCSFVDRDGRLVYQDTAHVATDHHAKFHGVLGLR